MQDRTAQSSKTTRKKPAKTATSPKPKTRCQASDDAQVELYNLVHNIMKEISMTGENIDLLNQASAELDQGYYDPEGLTMLCDASAYRLQKYLQLLRKLPALVGEPPVKESVLPKGLGRSLKVVNISIAQRGVGKKRK